jgi:hypothetical protein
MLLMKLKPLPKKGGFEMCKCNNHEEVAGPLTCGNTMAGLIIFILIILQYKQKCHNQLFDNSTLFILVLYVVACCGKVKLGC